jgi:hypothetical protein
LAGGLLRQTAVAIGDDAQLDWRSGVPLGGGGAAVGE